MRRSFIAERYAPLIEALYDGTKEKHVETEVVFEDGRKGRIKADVRIEDARVYGGSSDAQFREAAE